MAYTGSPRGGDRANTISVDNADAPQTRQESGSQVLGIATRPPTAECDKKISEITNDFAEFVTVPGVRPDDRSRRGSRRTSGSRQRRVVRGRGIAVGGDRRRRRRRRHFTAGWHYNVPALLIFR